MSNSQYQHWQLETDSAEIQWLTLDRADAAANSLNKAVLEEFSLILDAITLGQAPKGLIIRSGKSNGFIAGADIEQFRQITSVEEAVSLIRQGQKIFDKLASLSFPTIALIEGFCLGGGVRVSVSLPLPYC